MRAVLEAAQLWDHGRVSDRVLEWLQGEPGKCFLAMSNSQVAGLQDAVAGAERADKFEELARSYLVGVANRRKGESVLSRTVGGRQVLDLLLEEIAGAPADAVKRGGRLEASHRCARNLLGRAESRPWEEAMRVGILREFLQQLVKAHKAQGVIREIERERSNRGAGISEAR